MKNTLAGKMSKLPIIHGTVIIHANNVGNTSVQQNVISVSKRTRGKEALAHINMNINAQAFKPIVKLYTSTEPKISFIMVINHRIFSNNASKIIKKPDNMNVKPYNIYSMTLIIHISDNLNVKIFNIYSMTSKIIRKSFNINLKPLNIYLVTSERECCVLNNNFTLSSK